MMLNMELLVLKWMFWLFLVFLLKTSMFLFPCLQNAKFVLSDAAAAPGPDARRRGQQKSQSSQRWDSIKGWKHLSKFLDVTVVPEGITYYSFVQPNPNITMFIITIWCSVRLVGRKQACCDSAAAQRGRTLAQLTLTSRC